MQNLALFWATSKFGGEYLWTGWRCLNCDKYFKYRDSSCVRQNKSGKVWSSNLKNIDMKSYPPKARCSKDYISAPRGCCTPKCLHSWHRQCFPARNTSSIFSLSRCVCDRVEALSAVKRQCQCRWRPAADNAPTPSHSHLDTEEMLGVFLAGKHCRRRDQKVVSRCSG